MKLAQIVDNGNDIETLKELRKKIASTIDESKSGRDIAALSRQLQMVMTQIKTLEAETDNEDTVLAQIRRKHASQSVRDTSRRPLHYSDDEFGEDDTYIEEEADTEDDADIEEPDDEE